MSERACATYGDLVASALAWKQQTFWMGFGRSTTPWTTEDNPPTPTPGTTDIEEALFFVKLSGVTLVKPVTQEEYDALDADARDMCHGQCYAFVADEDADAELARWVLLKGALDPSLGHPTGTVRQIGVFTELVPQAGYENATTLLPAHVTDHGRLRWLDQDPPASVTSSYKLTRRIVREFR